MKALHVAKFGGSSVRDAEAMKRCARIIVNDPQTRLVVVSATKGTTNDLEAMARLAVVGQVKSAKSLLSTSLKRHLELCDQINYLQGEKQELSFMFKQAQSLLESVAEKKTITKKEMDELYSLGERSSSLIFAGILNNFLPKRSAELLDARKYIKTDSKFNEANPKLHEIEKRCLTSLRPALENTDVIFITQGFIGSTPKGETSTLGREGSDFSGALFANGLHADALYIWTDVPGIASSDPRMVQNVRFMRELSYHEAKLMAENGANVLHHKTLWPVSSKEIPVFVGSSLNPLMGGTWIKPNCPTGVPRAITVKKDQSRVLLKNSKNLDKVNFSKEIFSRLTKYDLPLTWNTFGEDQIHCVLPTEDLSNLMTSSLREVCDVVIESGMNRISFIGGPSDEINELTQRVCTDITSMGGVATPLGQEQSLVSFLVEDERTIPLVQGLHAALFEQGDIRLSEAPREVVL